MDDTHCCVWKGKFLRSCNLGFLASFLNLWKHSNMGFDLQIQVKYRCFWGPQVIHIIHVQHKVTCSKSCNHSNVCEEFLLYMCMGHRKWVCKWISACFRACNLFSRSRTARVSQADVWKSNIRDGACAFGRELKSRRTSNLILTEWLPHIHTYVTLQFQNGI